MLSGTYSQVVKDVREITVEEWMTVILVFNETILEEEGIVYSTKDLFLVLQARSDRIKGFPLSIKREIEGFFYVMKQQREIKYFKV